MSPTKVIPKKPKPTTPAPKPTTTTTTTPAPVTTTPLPQPAARIGSYGNASIDQWDKVFSSAVHAVAQKRDAWVNARVLKAMMDVETGGDGNYPPTKCRPADGFDNVPACGPMQIKWQYHKDRCPECNSKTVAGQVEMAAHIIGMTMLERGKDEYDAITAVYFPGADTNGTTQAGYLKRVRSLVKQMEQDANGTTPAVTTTPAPAPQGDVIDLLYGGKPYTITAEYGQLVTWSCPGCYDYQTAYGLDTRHHYAYDLSAAAGEGAPLYAPFDGLVVCAGTDNGPGAWNTGCSAFPRLNNYGGKPAGAGAGRLELLNEEGTASLIMGHVLSSRVRPGDRVQAGDLIGYEGGMNAQHTHLEGRYDQGRRIGDPRKLFGGGPITVTPERIPYDWDNDPNTFTVKALSTVKVYQRADPSSPVLDTIPAGDTFTAVAMVPGNDGNPWWLGIGNGRVPVSGTEAKW